MIESILEMDSNRVTRRRFLSLTAAIGGTAAATGTTVAASDSAEVVICFPDQVTDGRSMTVERATLPDGGFVAIHDAKSLLAGNYFNSVIGVSEYLDAGTHQDVTVNLFRDVPGESFDQSRLANNQMVVAIPYTDTNSSEVYEFVQTEGTEDNPYMRSGRVISDPATIRVKDI